MQVTTKDAAITNTDASDEDFPGSFEVVLSAPTKDRDGDTLLADEWKTPLPTRINFDTDHGMSVASVVGSGVPRIDEKSGQLIVAGTYSSLPRAQEVRTLVKEGHVSTVSVAFMTEPSTTKDGKPTKVRELLNGAFVAIPSNREAVVLSSKSLTAKEGRRNNSSDADSIQQMHDLASGLGASCAAKAAHGAEVKSIAGSIEATRDRAADAVDDAYPGLYTYLRGTLPDVLIFDVWTPAGECETYSQPYTDDGSVITLTGVRTPVDITEVVVPDADEDREFKATAPEGTAEKAVPADTRATAEDPSFELRVKEAAVLAALTAFDEED